MKNDNLLKELRNARIDELLKELGNTRIDDTERTKKILGELKEIEKL